MSEIILTNGDKIKEIILIDFENLISSIVLVCHIRGGQVVRVNATSVLFIN